MLRGETGGSRSERRIAILASVGASKPKLSTSPRATGPQSPGSQRLRGVLSSTARARWSERRVHLPTPRRSDLAPPRTPIVRRTNGLCTVGRPVALARRLVKPLLLPSARVMVRVIAEAEVARLDATPFAARPPRETDGAVRPYLETSPGRRSDAPLLRCRARACRCVHPRCADRLRQRRRLLGGIGERAAAEADAGQRSASRPSGVPHDAERAAVALDELPTLRLHEVRLARVGLPLKRSPLRRGKA
jgi:hypothetical protein